MIEIFQVLDKEIIWGIQIDTHTKIAVYTKNNKMISPKEIPTMYKDILCMLVVKGSSLIGVPLPA